MSVLDTTIRSYETQLRHGDLPPGVSDADVDGPADEPTSEELDPRKMEQYIESWSGEVADALDIDDDAKLLKQAKEIRDKMRRAAEVRQ